MHCLCFFWSLNEHSETCWSCLTLTINPNEQVSTERRVMWGCDVAGKAEPFIFGKTLSCTICFYGDFGGLGSLFFLSGNMLCCFLLCVTTSVCFHIFCWLKYFIFINFVYWHIFNHYPIIAWGKHDRLDDMPE